MPNSLLSSIYKYDPVTNAKKFDLAGYGMSQVPPAGFSPVTRTLPNNTGTYQSPVISQPKAPVAPTPVTPSAPAALDYSKYTDPATGKILSPQDYANMLASRVNGGSIPNYAGNALTQGPQTTPQLQSTATDLNNERNDIATGTTDPYAVASKSGIAYSPNELSAIEKAYAGIYDPALKDVFSKLDAKAKQDASAADLKNQLALQAQKHLDDVSLKKTPTATEALALQNDSSGIYVPGSNATVDAWVKNISNSNGKIGINNVPANLKNLVSQGLSQTTSSADDILSSTSKAINDLNDMVTNNQGFAGAVGAKGPTSLFGLLSSPLAGTPAADFDAKLKQVTSGPVLDNLSILKGIGRVSQKEFDTLQSAITSLGTSESEGQFKKDLKTLTDFVASQSSGAKAGQASVTDPNGGVHTFPNQAAADAFKKAIGQ